MWASYSQQPFQTVAFIFKEKGTQSDAESTLYLVGAAISKKRSSNASVFGVLVMKILLLRRPAAYLSGYNFSGLLCTSILLSMYAMNWTQGLCTSTTMKMQKIS